MKNNDMNGRVTMKENKREAKNNCELKIYFIEAKYDMYDYGL